MLNSIVTISGWFISSHLSSSPWPECKRCAHAVGGWPRTRSGAIAVGYLPVSDHQASMGAVGSLLASFLCRLGFTIGDVWCPTQMERERAVSITRPCRRCARRAQILRGLGVLSGRGAGRCGWKVCLTTTLTRVSPLMWISSEIFGRDLTSPGRRRVMASAFTVTAWRGP